MLSEKPWKLEAILRLGASIVMCICLGALMGVVIQFFEGPKRANPILFGLSVAGALGAFGGALFLLRQPWLWENFTRNYVTMIVCAGGGVFLTGWDMHALGDTGETEPSILRIVIAVLAFQGATLLLVSRFLREHGMDWSEGFGFKIEWRRALLFGLMFAPAFLPIGWGLQWTSGQIMERLHFHPEEQAAVEVLRNAQTLWNSLVLGVAAVLFAPVAEEMVFRGILYPAIKQYGFPRLAVWGPSVAFGLIHLNVAALLPLVVLAVLLTQLYEKTGNLLAPIVAHSLFNGLNFAMVYALQHKLDAAGSP
jgi:membrane protease YdiL (CAAX protease family)